MHKLLLLLLALGLARPALAQIAPVTENQQRAANRQALHDARRAESPYKESHLNVQPSHLKRGTSAATPGATTQGRPRSKHSFFGRHRAS